MPVSIIANQSANYAQRSLQTRGEAATVSIQKLSSGQRVFSAEQDAAALAVGAGIRVENASLSTARINASGGVSALQITDGALGEMGNVLTRMQTLAVQAASGNIADSERSLINQEYVALRSEVDRIANDTEFNGVFPLKGNAAFGLQGAHNYAFYGINNLAVGTNSITTDAVFRFSYDATNEQMTMTRTDTGVAQTQIIDLTVLLDNIAGPGNNLGAGQTLPLSFGGLGVTLTLGPTFNRTASILPTVTDNTGPNITLTTPTFAPATTGLGLDAITALQALPGGVYSAATGNITLPITSNGVNVNLGGVLPSIRYAVNGGALGASGAAATSLPAASNIDIYIDTAGGPVNLGRMTLPSITTTGVASDTLTVTLGTGLIGMDYTGTTAATTLTYMVGSGVIAGQDLVDVRIPAVNSTALNLGVTDVLSLINATSAMTALDTAQIILIQARSEVGAQQARLEVVAANLNVTIENNEAARSALLDTDVAAEITTLTTEQAMMEVGVSMLQQANRVPQMLIDLLRQS